MACHAALEANASSRRPVRVLRIAGASSAALALRAAGISASTGGRRRECYRYDGLYAVRKLAGGEDGEDGGEDGGEGVDEGGGGGEAGEANSGANGSASAAGAGGGVRFLLTRLPEQPALPPGVGGVARRKRSADEALLAPSTLSVYSEVLGMQPSASLSVAAEEVCIGESITVREVRWHTPSSPPPTSRACKCSMRWRHVRSRVWRRCTGGETARPKYRPIADGGACVSTLRMASLARAGPAAAARGARGLAQPVDRTGRHRAREAVRDQPSAVAFGAGAHARRGSGRVARRLCRRRLRGALCSRAQVLWAAPTPTVVQTVCAVPHVASLMACAPPLPVSLSAHVCRPFFNAHGLGGHDKWITFTTWPKRACWHA